MARRKDAFKRSEEKHLEVRSLNFRSFDRFDSPVQLQRQRDKEKFEQQQAMVKKQLTVEQQERERIASLKDRERVEAKVLWIFGKTLFLFDAIEFYLRMGKCEGSASTNL